MIYCTNYVEHFQNTRLEFLICAHLTLKNKNKKLRVQENFAKKFRLYVVDLHGNVF